MSQSVQCDVCNEWADILPDNFDGIHLHCPRCGRFKITRRSLLQLRRDGRGEEAKISGWIRDRNRMGDVPLITDARLASILEGRMPGVAERANRLLAEMARTGSMGRFVETADPALLAATYSASRDELDYLLRFLEEQGLIRNLDKDGTAEVAPRGYIHAEDLMTARADSVEGFVAMWFDSSMMPAFDGGIEPGIRAAGYKPIRVDRVEHAGKIDDEIIAAIRRARFVVADFTGHRGGVYFEAGFAMGLGLPVMWACRKDDIGALHFDVRQFNCIDWEDPAELARRLQTRIEAVIGQGPYKALGSD